MTQLRSDWFQVRDCGQGIWQIAEPQHVSSFLVVGSERAVLVDTGLGIRPIRPVVESLTDRPVTVVNSHSHFDHVGGNHEFDDVLTHPAAVGVIETPIGDDYLVPYLEHLRRQVEAAKEYRTLDRDFFWSLTVEGDPKELPGDFDPSTWRIEPPTPTGVLSDRQKLDLGGRELTVVFTPGHTPDGVSLLDEVTGQFLAGDTFNMGPLYAHYEDADLAAYISSADLMTQLGTSVGTVLAAHNSHPIVLPSLFRETAEALKALADGSVPASEAFDIMGFPCREAHFDHLWVTLPPIEVATDD